MSRCIDADVWCEDCKEYDKEHHNCPRFNRVIRTALEDADMVRVVRCKECKWAEPNREGDYDCRCHIPIFRVSADDYCSFGERRE